MRQGALCHAAQLPTAITARLNAALNQALAAPEVVERMRAFGMEPLAGTPEQFHALARAEARRWGPVIAATGVKLD